MRSTIRRHSQVVIAVSLAFTLVFVSVAAIGASWSDDQRQPRVTLLGAGDAVSVYVTSGPARFLLVASNEPPALDNAVDRARPPGLTRLDILLASGHDADYPAAARAIRRLDPRYVGIIGDSARFLTDGVQVTETIDRPRAFVLPGELRIAVETSDSDSRPQWRVTIAKDETVVVILSDRAALSAFPQPFAVALTVFAREAPDEEDVLFSGALAVSAELRPDRFKERLQAVLGPDGFGLRIHDEEAVRFDFVDDGLRLPDHGVISGEAGEPASSAS